MALKFKIMKRKHRRINGVVQELYYAIQEEHPRVSWKEVERRISSRTGVNRADLRAVVIALHDVLEEELRCGRAVDIVELGTFKAVAFGKMMNSIEEVTPDTIGNPKVQFFKRKTLDQALQGISIELSRELYLPRAQRKRQLGKSTPSKGK